MSDPKTQSPTEAWAWIEDLTTAPGGGMDPSAVCAGADGATLPTATRDGSKVALPTVLHYWYRATLHTLHHYITTFIVSFVVCSQGGVP